MPSALPGLSIERGFSLCHKEGRILKGFKNPKRTIAIVIRVNQNQRLVNLNSKRFASGSPVYCLTAEIFSRYWKFHVMKKHVIAKYFHKLQKRVCLYDMILICNLSRVNHKYPGFAWVKNWLTNIFPRRKNILFDCAWVNHSTTNWRPPHIDG